MSARGHSTTRWRRSWRDRLPPRREWPAMFAAIALVILLAVEVLRPDLVWRVFA
jgi:hypothetical protein